MTSPSNCGQVVSDDSRNIQYLGEIDDSDRWVSWKMGREDKRPIWKSVDPIHFGAD